MMLADWQIVELVQQQQMIDPFLDHQIRDGKISYGLSSAGYDMRLGNRFKEPLRNNKVILDPKNPDASPWANFTDPDYYDIQPGVFVLGVSVERFNLPDSVCMQVVGKSTYARAGLIVNVTPGEPGWRGFLTIMLSNSGPNPVRVYVNEGIAQAKFHRIMTPSVTYAARVGKYQDQPAKPITSRL